MNLLEKEFVPYQESLELKELGFDEPCLNKYDPRFKKLSSDMETWTIEYFPETLMIPAPTFSQAFRWFREKYGLDNARLKDRFVIETEEDLPIWYYGFKSYEEAELACLRKLIEIVKNTKP